MVSPREVGKKSILQLLEFKIEFTSMKKTLALYITQLEKAEKKMLEAAESDEEKYSSKESVQLLMVRLSLEQAYVDIEQIIKQEK